MELDSSEMSDVLSVITGTEAEVESLVYQVRNMTDLLVRGCCGRGHDGVDDSKGDWFCLLVMLVLNIIGFKLAGEAAVQYSVGLGIWRFYGIGETIQEIDHCNCPPCLENQLFPKSVQVPLGVVSM